MSVGLDRHSKPYTQISSLVVVSVKEEVSSALIKLSQFLIPSLLQTLPSNSAHPSAYRSLLSGCGQASAREICLSVTSAFLLPLQFTRLLSFIMNRACSGRDSIFLLVNTLPLWSTTMNALLKNKTLMTTLILGEASSAFQGLPNRVHVLLLILDMLEKLILMSNL